MYSGSKPIIRSTSLTPLIAAVAVCLVAGCVFPEAPRRLSSIPQVPAGTMQAQFLTFDADEKPVSAENQREAKKPASVVHASYDSPDQTGHSDSLTTSDAAGAPLVLSLPQAIDFGLQKNPRLLSALAAIERARGQEDIAFSPFLPTLEFLTHGGVTSPELGPASAGATGIILPSGAGTHSFAQAELQVQWTVYDFGRTSGRYHQAKSREAITELQSARVRQTVGFEVASAYLTAQRAGATRRIQDEAIRRAEATLHDTRARRAAGVAEKDDVLRAEVQLAAAQEDLDVAREAELAGIARLNNAMGRNASLPLSLVGWNSDPPFGMSLVQCLEIAASQRAEIKIAQQAIAAAQCGHDANRAEFLPKVYALASAGGLTGNNILTGSQEGAGLHIDMPLYTGGRLEGGLRASNAEIHQAVADCQTVLDGVTLQVTLAYLAATTAHRRIQRDQPAIVEAFENLRLVRNRYRNGQATPTDIVDAEVTLTRSQQRLISATYEYLGALVGLDYALDNPPTSLLGQPTPPAAPETPSPPMLPELLPAPKAQ
jgi:outer membrane protein